MAYEAPGLPTRFPCWCRAIYSWGGESKRDLGFIEGDLIECLNAGDGSWWMGRLRRDKRAMGLFPSNFVQVLDDGFVPRSRATSPMPAQTGGGSVSRGASPNPPAQKTKTTFRKPFQAYTRAASPNVASGVKDLESRSRGPSPSPNRLPSHLQPTSEPSSSVGNSTYGSRAPSPAPPALHSFHSRRASPRVYEDIGSSPPPPAPPPHRVAYNMQSRRTPSPAPSMNDRYPIVSRGPSPAPTSPGIQGHTPSPLRDAMEDVMSSLHDMAIRREAPSPSPERPRTPLDPWSPEAFEELRTKPRLHTYGRPQTSLGLGPSQEDDYQVDSAYESQHASPYNVDDDEPPYLSSYVQRMETRLRSMQNNAQPVDELFLPDNDMGPPPAPPPKNSPYQPRPSSSLEKQELIPARTDSDRKLRYRKSAYELGRGMIGRTFTTKSTATNSSSGVQSTTTNSSGSTQLTSQSIMSGYSAGGFSATSAGSLARRKGWGSISQRRPISVMDTRQDVYSSSGRGGSVTRPQTPLTGASFHSSHASRPASTVPGDLRGSVADSSGILGGLTSPKPKKTGFFKKLVESAKTGAASARSSIAAGQADAPRSPIKGLFPGGVAAIAGGNVARDMGLGGSGSGIDWVQIRRDVNRSNSLSRNERMERAERCQMLDYPIIAPVDAMFDAAEGDEGLDGLPISEPTNFQAANLQLVDKAARFISSLPPMTNPTSLAQGYVCRPYRSDVQRLRAIFTWVGEKVAWEEDFEGEVDSRRVIQMKRGCAEEVAVLVMEMCSSMGLYAEVVRGYLKVPGEVLDFDSMPQANHWWNAVLVDGEWRIMDCSLASPTNPKRGLYSNAGSQVAESWWFLARPMEICYTHIPSLPEQQHICPPISPDILLALPCACPPYFKNDLRMVDYDTSLFRVENLELVHVQFTVPSDIECFAEVEARAYARDSDGDLFESGESITKRALAQAEWIGGQKRYTVKGLLPGDEGQGVLKIYAGKRGLMHSIKDNPHPLAFALPIIHTGQNPPYDFFLRHPTPHAQRHDLYVAQPQCARLAINNTFVFAVRQHPSSLTRASSPPLPSPSPSPFTRPTSAMSMTSSLSTSTTNYFSLQHPASSSSTASGSSAPATQPSAASSAPFQQQSKPAKLAIQAPSGKILRLMRKSDHTISTAGGGEAGDGGVWETIIKVGERGVWRGLVLADRSARWCVFGEWECV
ncbi:cytokinesis protein 3 [Lignoscripta atroalba]|nr:cytokinesis protein 3 [Lignoscripta atroalba]